MIESPVYATGAGLVRYGTKFATDRGKGKSIFKVREDRVFDKVFGFDKIDGTFRIVDGEAYTCNLSLEGPAANIAIIGRGVESVLRRLIRFLVGTISLTKLHELIDHIYVEEMEEKLRRAEFDLEDFLDQMRQARQMGSMGQLLEMLPEGFLLTAAPETVSFEAREMVFYQSDLTPSGAVRRGDPCGRPPHLASGAGSHKGCPDWRGVIFEEGA